MTVLRSVGCAGIGMGCICGAGILCIGVDSPGCICGEGILWGGAKGIGLAKGCAIGAVRVIGTIRGD